MFFKRRSSGKDVGYELKRLVMVVNSSVSFFNVVLPYSFNVNAAMS